MALFNQNQIRNFVIIAHINHGKSTLADRLLEITGTVAKDKLKEQFLDAMDLEREKGITIKMHPVRLVWQANANKAEILNSPSQIPNKIECATTEFILNLIDTPGHIDFSYETSRALACCEGAVLLVDVNKGIQSQTLFNLEQAQKQGLKVIGAINKIDLATQEQIFQAKKELALILKVAPQEILAVSGKTGQGVSDLLQKIIEYFPAPQLLDSKSGTPDTGFKALIFDSKYDGFCGVIAYVRIFCGEIRPGDKIFFFATQYSCEVKEVGYFTPSLVSCDTLKAGEIGYIKTGIKEPLKVRVGDTIFSAKKYNTSDTFNLRPLPGYQEPQPVLFLSLYPQLADDFDMLKEALNKHKLNDPSFNFQIESQMALGRGFRCGFLGPLHAEITIRRLKNEFGLDLITTCAQVVFRAVLKNGKEVLVSSPALFPNPSSLAYMEEPMVKVEIIIPNSYLNRIFALCPSFEINITTVHSLNTQKSIISAVAPLREIISGSFYEQLKSVTEGYGSFSFEHLGFQKADLVKVDVLIGGYKEDVFSKILPRQKAFKEMKNFLQKLKEVLPPQQFALSLQAAIEGKIIAREDIRALRKDVTAKLYGGDVTRKQKLLKAQKRGKQKLKERASRINIPERAFLDIFKI